VGYVKKNFLHGLELTDFSTIHAAAQVWLDTIANVRIHSETQTATRRLLAQERPHLGPLNPHPYDIALTSTSVASSQFRITLDTNQYSVPGRIRSSPIDGQSLSGPGLHLLRQPAHRPSPRAAMIVTRTSRSRTTPRG